MGFGASNSSGQNNFVSQPQNLQNPTFQAISGPIGYGILNAAAGGNYGVPTTGTNGAQTGNISPYQGQFGYFGNPQSNPLVAPVQGWQTPLLNNIGNIGQYTANSDFGGQQSSAAQANQFAQGNPLAYANQQNQLAAGAAPNYGTGLGYASQGANAGQGIGSAYGAWSPSAFSGAQNALNSAGGIYSGYNAWQQPAFNTAQNAYNPAYQANADASGTGRQIASSAVPYSQQAGNIAGSALNPAYGAAYNMLSPNYAASLATSPQTQAAIQSAVNPLINSFNTQTIPGLQGSFTAAGQRLGNANGGLGGSSAFDIAGSNALTGLEANIGNVSGNIANQAYQTGLAQQANAINQVGNLAGTQAGIFNQTGQNIANTLGTQAGALNSAAATGGNLATSQIGQLLAGGTGAANAAAQQAGAQANAAGQFLAGGAGAANAAAQQAGALTGAGATTGNILAQQQGGLNQTAQTSGALQSENVQNLLQSSAGSSGLLTSILNNTINSLNASALPQLTQQYGINQGLQLYQTQVSQMLQALGLGAQASQPNIGVGGQGQGTSSSKGANFGIPLLRA